MFIGGRDGSATVVGGRVREHAPLHHGSGFHLPERLLRPRYAPVWDRTGEDWQLTDEVGDAGEGLGQVTLRGTAGALYPFRIVDGDWTYARWHPLLGHRRLFGRADSV